MQVSRISPVSTNYYNQRNLNIKRENINFTGFGSPSVYTKHKPALILTISSILASMGLAKKVSTDEVDKEMEDKVQALRKVHVWCTNPKNIQAHNFTVEKLATLNKVLAEDEDILARIYTRQDEIGKVPAHYASAEELRLMNDALAENPRALRKMYLTKNVKGKIVAHSADAAKLAVMHEGLKDQPSLLKEIYMTKQKWGRLPIHYADKDTFEFITNAFLTDSKFYLSMLKEPDKFYDDDIYPIVADTLDVVSELYSGSDAEKAKKLAAEYREYAAEYSSKH